MPEGVLPSLAHGPDLREWINLVGADAEDVAVSSLASRGAAGTLRIRTDDLEARAILDRCLPRVAQDLIVPEIVDLIPAGSWFASLANLLVGSSWKALKDPLIRAAGACEECGDTRRLEGHEKWSYDPGSRIQTLMTVRCLCSRCHAMQHLGRANIVGNFGGVFRRLCLVNRIERDEKEAYLSAIFSLFEQRSAIEWSLDVSDAVRALGSLSLKEDVLFDGDGWIYRPAGSGRPETAMRIVGSEIGYDGRRLVLVPAGEL